MEASLQGGPKAVLHHKVKGQEVPLVLSARPWPKAEEVRLTKCWGPSQTQVGPRGSKQGVPRGARAWWNTQTLAPVFPVLFVGVR